MTNNVNSGTLFTVLRWSALLLYPEDCGFEPFKDAQVLAVSRVLGIAFDGRVQGLLARA